MRRADVRLVGYRKKSNLEYPERFKKEYEELQKVKLSTDKWEDFSILWDVFVNKDKVVRIVPELDYNYVNTTCIEIKTKISLGISEEEIEKTLNDRQLNIYNIVNLHYLGDTVDWNTYNLEWGIKIDHDSNRMEVYSKKTDNQIIKPVKKDSEKDILSKKIKEILMEMKET